MTHRIVGLFRSVTPLLRQTIVSAIKPPVQRVAHLSIQHTRAFHVTTAAATKKTVQNDAEDISQIFKNVGNNMGTVGEGLHSAAASFQAAGDKFINDVKKSFGASGKDFSALGKALINIQENLAILQKNVGDIQTVLPAATTIIFAIQEKLKDVAAYIIKLDGDAKVLHGTTLKKIQEDIDDILRNKIGGENGILQQIANIEKVIGGDTGQQGIKGEIKAHQDSIVTIQSEINGDGTEEKPGIRKQIKLHEQEIAKIHGQLVCIAGVFGLLAVIVLAFRQEIDEKIITPIRKAIFDGGDKVNKGIQNTLVNLNTLNQRLAALEAKLELSSQTTEQIKQLKTLIEQAKKIVSYELPSQHGMIVDQITQEIQRLQVQYESSLFGWLGGRIFSPISRGYSHMLKIRALLAMREELRTMISKNKTIDLNNFSEDTRILIKQAYNFNRWPEQADIEFRENFLNMKLSLNV